MNTRPHTHTKCGTEVSSSVPHFLHRVPSGAPPPHEAPSMEPLQRERCYIPRVPFIHLSKSPVDEPSSMFPKRGPYGKKCPPPEPFLPILQGPQQRSPPSRFPSQSSHRETRHILRERVPKIRSQQTPDASSFGGPFFLRRYPIFSA